MHSSSEAASIAAAPLPPRPTHTWYQIGSLGEEIFFVNI